MSQRHHIKQAKRPELQRRSRVVAIVGLAVLAAVAVALTAIAVVGPRDAVSTTPVVQPTEPSPEVEVSPEPEVVAVPVAVPVQRLLVAGQAPGQLLRATVGTCPEPGGTIEVSVDNGVEWQTATTADVSSTQILQLDAATAGMVRFVSLNSECQPQLSRSFVGGLDWEPAEGLETAWFLDPSNPAVVRTPSGAQALPCSAVGLASAAEGAIALCSDASITVSGDAGASWSVPLAVPNASAVGTIDGGFVVASVDEPDCVGVRVREVSGDAVGEDGQCFAADGAAGGNTAVSGRAGELHLWAGDAFTRSTDRGATWQ